MAIQYEWFHYWHSRKRGASIWIAAGVRLQTTGLMLVFSAYLSVYVAHMHKMSKGVR